jgi:hypothetical protein
MIKRHLFKILLSGTLFVWGFQLHAQTFVQRFTQEAIVKAEADIANTILTLELAANMQKVGNPDTILKYTIIMFPLLG